MNFIKLILIYFLFTNKAYAYIDPGFIAGFFNLIVASIASLAVIFIFRPYYFFKNLFSKFSKKKDTNKDTNKENPEDEKTS
tara:strand:- start:514 stop:756 length:243 start_codon:yes stop_codon:yes gene_type:complete